MKFYGLLVAFALIGAANCSIKDDLQKLNEYLVDNASDDSMGAQWRLIKDMQLDGSMDEALGVMKKIASKSGAQLCDEDTGHLLRIVSVPLGDSAFHLPKTRIQKVIYDLLKRQSRYCADIIRSRLYNYIGDDRLSAMSYYFMKFPDVDGFGSYDFYQMAEKIPSGTLLEREDVLQAFHRTRDASRNDADHGVMWIKFDEKTGEREEVDQVKMGNIVDKYFIAPCQEMVKRVDRFFDSGRAFYEYKQRHNFDGFSKDAKFAIRAFFTARMCQYYVDHIGRAGIIERFSKQVR